MTPLRRTFSHVESENRGIGGSTAVLSILLDVIISILSVSVTISPLVVLANSIILVLSSAAVVIAITTLRMLILAGTLVLAVEFISVQYSELALYASLSASVSISAAIIGIQVHGSHMTVGTLAGIIILVLGSTNSIEDGILENIVLY